MVSKNQATGLWNELFCPHYGKMIDLDKFDVRKCDTCPVQKNCRRKYLRKLFKKSKVYGDFSKIPQEELM